MKKSEEEEIELFYKEKYAFVQNLIKHFPRKTGAIEEDDSDDDENVVVKSKLANLPERLFPGKTNKKPARTIDELQAKLKALKGKSKLPYKQKLLKKGLKNKLKKREKKRERKMKKHSNEDQEVKPENVHLQNAAKPKPVYNNEGQMIFSKFDFSELGTKQSDIKPHVVKDPEVALKKIKEEEQRIKELKKAGEIDKVKKIIEKKAVKAALLKSEGVTVKDDPELLKKSIMKKKMKKDKSAKKWEVRKSQVEKRKEAKQQKRTENIQKKIKEKKGKKMKQLVKKGRVILQ